MFKAPRGTVDILPEEQRYWRFFHQKAREIAERFGYRRIDTPVFEDARLFMRGIGEATDVVEKETYTFQDRGGDLLTLRPEGTAPVCRAYLEHGMHNLPQPVRLYYLCPVFRYERPQSGRYRQHHQFGIEAIGDPDSAVDAEVIEVAWRFLEAVGLRDLTLYVNSIGDPQCRPAYVEALRRHYRDHEDRICPDCRRRLHTNPLRLLDCKQEVCQPFIASAPQSVEYLCAPCQEHWQALLAYLESLELPYQVENRLVRGFDYYTRTVFEISPPEEGRMSTIVGGGRYDGLIEELGGRPTPGIGFGMGIERVILNIKRQEAAVPDYGDRVVLVACLGHEARRRGLRLASDLRRAGRSAVLAPSGRSLKGQLRYASALGAAYAVIIGDEELRKGTLVLRDMEHSRQQELPAHRLLEALGGP